MDIVQYFNQIHPLPQEAQDVITSVFEPMALKKGTKIKSSNKKFHKVMFVEKGLIRLYYDKEEKDITFLFLDENSFSAPINAIYFNTPEKYSWHVLEDTSIRLINNQQLDNLMLQFPFFEKLARFILIALVKIISDKLNALQFQTAEERYHYMEQNYLNILARAPLGHIASYLGITQQTLSVIRSKK